MDKKKAALLTKPAQDIQPSNNTKLSRVREELRKPQGLNRFEAERIGDHTINSTVARLRQMGEVINSRWEVVPTRFTPRGVRVLRYWSTSQVGGANE